MRFPFSEQAERDREINRRERANYPFEPPIIFPATAGGLSFWQTLFVFLVTCGLIVVGVETGTIPKDYWKYIEKSFSDYNKSVENEYQRQHDLEGRQ